MYYSESSSSNVCGSIDVKYFPYKYNILFLKFNNFKIKFF
jgi:hypothetical protein